MGLQVEAVVHQINTGSRGGAYVNVLSGLNEGGIGIWGHCYKLPTYLLIRGDTWLMVTFDDEAWCDQEFSDIIRTWAAERVYLLPTMEQVL